MANLRWEWLPWTGLDRDTLHAVITLREAVFVVEQACAYQEVDGRDPEAHHLLAWDGDTLVAYLRAFPPTDARPEAVIGRVIVAPSARGTGLGRRLMEEALAGIEATWGPVPVWLSGQAHLADWYRSLGFEVCGEGYDEDGIPHVPMRRPAT